MRKISMPFMFVLVLCFLLGWLMGDIWIWPTLFAQPPEPNAVAQPHTIIFPEKVLTRYKCPTHGITEKILTLEIEGVQAKYCNVCVMRFVAALLDLNSPKLELVNENALDPNEAKK